MAFGQRCEQVRGRLGQAFAVIRRAHTGSHSCHGKIISTADGCARDYFRALRWWWQINRTCIVRVYEGDKSSAPWDHEGDCSRAWQKEVGRERRDEACSARRQNLLARAKAIAHYVSRHAKVSERSTGSSPFHSHRRHRIAPHSTAHTTPISGLRVSR